MALLAWWPLDGNFENRGLDTETTPMTVTNGSFIDDGKIGKCLKLGYTNNIIIPSLIGSKQLSIAYWCRVDEATETNWLDTIHYYSTKDDGTEAQLSRQELFTNCTKTGFWFKGGYLRPFDVTVGEWNHYAFTIDYDEGIAAFYINGYKVGESSDVDKTHQVSATHNIKLGENGLSLSENDVRIYNHCLSPREVKELSKALVLHYKLDRGGFGQDNLLIPQISDDKWQNWYSSNWPSENTREKIVDEYGKTWAHVIQKTNVGYGGYSCSPANNGIAIDVNKKYTISALMKRGTATNAQIIFWVHWRSTEGGGNLSQSQYRCDVSNSGRVYAVMTPTPNADYTVNIINIMVGSSGLADNEIYFTDIKVEEGEIATPWTPHSSDDDYLNYGLDDNVEYDVSGYRHDGEKIGAVSYTSETPKYSVSTYINDTAQKIHISNFPTSAFGDSYSFAWWAKVSSVSPMQWGFSNGIRLNGMYTGRLWNTGDGTNNPLYNIGTTTQVTPPTTNVWHHYVMTGDGTNCYVYLDGVLWAQAKTYKSISGDSIYINGWDHSTSYCSNNMLMSDFRIYATALSAEDVSRLYNAPISLANSGTLFAGEFVEE